MEPSKKILKKIKATLEKEHGRELQYRKDIVHRPEVSFIAFGNSIGA